jgi:hypothetical protein
MTFDIFTPINDWYPSRVYFWLWLTEKYNISVRVSCVIIKISSIDNISQIWAKPKISCHENIRHYLFSTPSLLLRSHSINGKNMVYN